MAKDIWRTSEEASDTAALIKLLGAQCVHFRIEQQEPTKGSHSLFRHVTPKAAERSQDCRG